MVQTRKFFGEYKANYFILVTVILGVLFFVYYTMANNGLYVIYIFSFVYLYFIYDFYVRYSSRFTERDRYFLRLWPLSLLGTFFGLLILGSLIYTMIHMGGYGVQDGKTMFLFTLVLALTFFGAISVSNIYRNFRGNHHVTKDMLVFVHGKETEELELGSVLGVGVAKEGVVYVALEKQELKFLDSLSDLDKDDDDFSYRAKQIPVFVTYEGSRLINDLVKKGFVRTDAKNFVLLKKA